jgi:hypothetical protein
VGDDVGDRTANGAFYSAGRWTGDASPIWAFLGGEHRSNDVTAKTVLIGHVLEIEVTVKRGGGGASAMPHLVDGEPGEILGGL